MGGGGYVCEDCAVEWEDWVRLDKLIGYGLVGCMCVCKAV